MSNDADSGEPPGSQTEVPLERRIVQSLLDRHRVPARRRTTLLQEVLGISYGAARRRYETADTPFTFTEIQRLTEFFGERLAREVMLADGSALGEPVDASVRLDGVVSKCMAWTSTRHVPIPTTMLVAQPDVANPQQQGLWRIVRNDRLPEGEPDAAAREVYALFVELPLPKRVGVLDDDTHVAQSLVEFLRSSGLDAYACASVDELLEQMRRRPTDGLVLDWLIGAQTIEPRLGAIRALCPHGPVVILTGQIEAGHATAAEVSTIAEIHRALLFEKPTRPVGILTALRHGLSSPATAGAAGAMNPPSP